MPLPEQTDPPVPLFSERILATLKSPDADDSDSIELLDGALRSRVSGRTYSFIDGVPSLFGGEGEGDDVRGRVQDFYEENPFPSYEGLEEFGELVNKGRRNPFTTQLLDFDSKRLHYFHQMYRAQDDTLAATNELVSLHVAQETRRSAPMAPEILERLGQIQRSHGELAIPPQVGRVMGLKATATT